MLLALGSFPGLLRQTLHITAVDERSKVGILIAVAFSMFLKNLLIVQCYKVGENSTPASFNQSM